MAKKYNFSVGVMFKNESHIMKEWINHYLRIGVDHIYMINHSSNDNYMDILTKYVNDKVVTLYHSEHKPKRLAQIEQYNKNITPHVKDSQWFAFLDMDEFLYSRKNNNVLDILNNSEYLCHAVPWLNFGSNGLQDIPKSVIKSFTKRANYDNFKNNFVSLRQIKTVFNTDPFQKVVELHYVDKFGKRHNVVPHKQHQKFSEESIKKTDLAINHYSVQSYNWFIKNKTKKRAGNSAHIKYTSEYWEKMDTNQIEDTTLLNQYENKDNK